MEKWSDKFELNGMHLREKKELKSFTRISARPLTFSLRLSDLSIIPHNRFRRKKRDYYPPPWNLRRTCPSPSTIHDSRASRKRNKIGLSTVSRSNRTFEQETRSDSRRRTCPEQPPPPLELPRQILHNYRGERGTFFLFSLESRPSLETVVSDNLWQKASAETWTISCKERNRGERGNPVSIAPVTNVVKDRYESSLASNTKSGERGRGGERGNSAANFLTAPIFCERTLDLP